LFNFIENRLRRGASEGIFGSDYCIILAHARRMKRKHDNSSSRVDHINDMSQMKWASRLTPESLKAKSTAGEAKTVSIAIPGSILRQAQTKELKTMLVGQIARVVAIYEIDEIVVFMDSSYESNMEEHRRPTVFFSRILQYIETPPYLRKHLFPMSAELKFCGMLPPLETPHHMRRDDKSLYREGVTLDKLSHSEPPKSIVNVGLFNELELDRALRPGVRVTVRLDNPGKSRKLLVGCACAPSEPRQKYGLYWGYQTRLASSLSEVFSRSPYKGGYDMLIGSSCSDGDTFDGDTFEISKTGEDYNHLLIVFGGEGGIESCVDADETLSTKAANTRSLFDHWLNFVNTGGTRKVCMICIVYIYDSNN
jgi:methyltransferase